ncbi:MAG: SurA N-terminal domain-containing protein [Candidatus Binataceae bacterium]
MLNVMRRHAYSWMVRVILFLIILVFAFWGMSGGFFSQVKQVAKVDGQTILADEVDHEATQLRRTLQQIYGPNTPEVLKHVNLRQEALGQIIENHLIQREAQHLGLEVNDAELKRRIESNQSFQIDGQFDFATYQAVLRDNDMTPPEFEQNQRAAILADTLKAMVTEGVQVSEEEARAEFDRRNLKLTLAYIEVPYTRFAGKITPAEAEIADYYKKNGEEFREPERVKVVFVHYDPAILAQSLKPSDKEIQDYYARNQATLFTHPLSVHARHILIATPAGATGKEKAAANAKAKDVLRQLKAGANFAKLAAKYSDDTGNKLKGGDLGTFGKGEMVKPFEQVAFKLRPGDAALAETQFGYHVIKVDETFPPHVDSLEQARPKIIQALRSKAGGELVREAMHEDLTAALAGQSLSDLANKRGLDAVETPFFAANEPVKGTEQNPELARDALKMEEGDVRAITHAGSDPYIVKLIKRQPSRIPELKEIKAKVREAVIRSKAEQAAREFANSIAEQIKSPDDFAKLAAANHLEIHNTGEFSRTNHMVPLVGDFPEVTDAASQVAAVPAMLGRVMVHGADSYIFEVLDRRPPGAEEWEKDGPPFTEEILQARRAQVWNGFVDALKQRAKIEVDTDQLGETSTEPSM